MGKVAFVFAGQGAQYPGMGKELYEMSAAARSLMDAAERIRPGTLQMCFSGDKAELSQTIHTQPCLYMVDCACAWALREAGVGPDAVAGFSLGEVAAAAFAGMMSFEEGFRLVVRRAELMQACAQKHPGGMAAVLKLTGEQVEEICSRFPEAWPVNYNCPGQTVVACRAEDMDDFAAAVKAASGRAMKLSVSGAFHSPYMREAAEGLREYLKEHPLNAPALPVYANRTARPYEGDAGELLSSQIASPVRWQQTVENMRADGVNVFVEVGAGTTLCGLIGKTDSSLVTANVTDSASLDAAIEKIREDAV